MPTPHADVLPPVARRGWSAGREEAIGALPAPDGPIHGSGEPGRSCRRGVEARVRPRGAPAVRRNRPRLRVRLDERAPPRRRRSD
jgi:hypothetical protein